MKKIIALTLVSMISTAQASGRVDWMKSLNSLDTKFSAVGPRKTSTAFVLAVEPNQACGQCLEQSSLAGQKASRDAYAAAAGTLALGSIAAVAIASVDRVLLPHRSEIQYRADFWRILKISSAFVAVGTIAAFIMVKNLRENYYLENK